MKLVVALVAVIFLVVLMGIDEQSSVVASCPENCWSYKHYGTCSGGQCQCASGRSGPQCAYGNLTSCLDGHCSGFTGQSDNDISAFFVDVSDAPFDDCEHVRIRMYSGNDPQVYSDDEVVADFLVELKALRHDVVDPYCFTWLVDPVLAPSSPLCCIDIHGRTTSNGAAYLLTLSAQITGVDGVLSLATDRIFNPPSRCNDPSCAVNFDDDLGSTDWTSINIRHTAPFVVTAPVSSAAARFVLKFAQTPPDGLTATWAVSCQPTGNNANEAQVLSSTEWLIFEGCGMVWFDTVVYISFVCRQPPCSFRVAERMSFLDRLAVAEPLSYTGALVPSYFTVDDFLNSRWSSYNVTVAASYPSTVDASNADFPFLLLSERINLCPTDDIGVVPTYSRLVQDQTVTWSMPYSSFERNRRYVFRVQGPADKCAIPANSYLCDRVVYSIYLDPVTVPSPPHDNNSGVPAGLIAGVVVGLLLLAGAGAGLWVWYQKRNASPAAQGYSPSFPDNADFLEDESEVDEVVVANTAAGDNQSSFGVNSTSFSL